ncbi:MAG: hypothetical protein US69_C0005G0030 [candidate division TM6 bacterium GW2011_GWF2_38_10]|nr:MAG: hypothetical protein US69_C0005G0030 [candidate division TM6 bacterium GW2011_GWF2_38_10]
MKCLEELEQRVLQVIQKNKDLQKQVDELLLTTAELEEKVRQYEVSLLQETNAASILSQEKASIMNTIEELLSTIKVMEEVRS